MSAFKAGWQTKALELQQVFTISRSSRTHQTNVFLSLSKDGITGYGEASPNSRYGESPESVTRFFEDFPFEKLSEIRDEDGLENLIRKCSDNESPQSARVAVEMAWLDWWAKSQHEPLWSLWGHRDAKGPVTSFTIGIDKPEVMQQKILNAGQYPVYKIKLGTDHDRELIDAVREITDKPIRVDANEGWESVDQALKEIEYLADQNVELVEQPMHASLHAELAELKKHSVLPLCADESFTGSENLSEIAACFHIINIKLMKIGSMVKARRVTEEAHKKGLKVMIGCMIESSLANAAGAVVALNAEYADLDGHLLISNDPFGGLEILENGRIQLSNGPGLGVLPYPL